MFDNILTNNNINFNLLEKNIYKSLNLKVNSTERLSRI